MSRRPTEHDEWLAELEQRWTDVYKKSATTVVILRSIAASGTIAAAELATSYVAQTGWTITERALYRTLQRLTSDGILFVTEIDAARTGAKRKEFSLSPMGTRFQNFIENQLLSTPAPSAPTPATPTPAAPTPAADRSDDDS